MNWHYAYTPYIWPMLATAVFVTTLAIYAWRRHSVPGAFPFAIAMLSVLPQAGSAALQLAAVDVSAKIFWFKFQVPWIVFGSTAILCFVLEYANLGRWLTRHTLTLLAIPILIQSLLVLTNDSNHWMWRNFSVGEYVQPVFGIGSWILIGYGYLLVLLHVITLLWLFVHSPLHRWPVALMLLCRLATSTAFLLGVVNRNPFAPMDPTILTAAFTSGVWAFALFYFRIFDPIPVARKIVIEQMQEGMLVLDTAQKIVDLNPAVERLFGLPATRVRGRNVADLMPVHAEMITQADGKDAAELEVILGDGAATRSYTFRPSLLKDRNGQALGYLILFHDVTEQKRAQAQLLDQQRALAALKEREQVARELHDELSQELAFINLQAQAANELMTAGEIQQAATHLARLADVARETQVDVRGQISKLSLNIFPTEGIVGALRRFIETFHRMYGIQAELVLSDEQRIVRLEPTVEVQLLRIAQEAFTNIRKHAGARNVRVSLSMEEPGCAEMTIEDDGVGFDPGKSGSDSGTFGLRIMRERAAEIGASLQVESEAGHGTRVIVRIPR